MGTALLFTGLAMIHAFPILGIDQAFVYVGAILMVVGTVAVWFGK